MDKSFRSQTISLMFGEDCKVNWEKALVMKDGQDLNRQEQKSSCREHSHVMVTAK